MTLVACRCRVVCLDTCEYTRPCVKCRTPTQAGDELCRACRKRDYDRRHAEQRRLAREDLGLCPDCGVVEVSDTYRCASCAEAKKLRELGFGVRHLSAAGSASVD